MAYFYTLSLFGFRLIRLCVRSISDAKGSNLLLTCELVS